MAKKSVAGTAIDPTIPTVKVTLDGKEYTLCFDLNALADAEAKLAAAGHEVNILQALPKFNLSTIRILFMAGLHRFQPELKYEDVERLFTFANFPAIMQAVSAAYTGSKPEPKADPTEADAEK